MNKFTFSGRSVYCNGPGDDRPHIFYAVKIRGTGLTTAMKLLHMYLVLTQMTI